MLGRKLSRQASQGPINWFGTLRQRRNGQRRPVFHQRQGRPQMLNLVLLDTSASTLKARGVNDALGATSFLYRQSYLRRQQFGLIGFGNQQVKWLLKPQRAGQRLSQRLPDLQAGGGTPLAEALRFTRQVLSEVKAAEVQLFLITDGISRDPIDPSPLPCDLTVIDTDRSPVKLAKARQLADSLGGRYCHLDQLEALSNGLAN